MHCGKAPLPAGRQPGMHSCWHAPHVCTTCLCSSADQGGPGGRRGPQLPSRPAIFECVIIVTWCCLCSPADQGGPGGRSRPLLQLPCGHAHRRRRAGHARSLLCGPEGGWLRCSGLQVLSRCVASATSRAPGRRRCACLSICPALFADSLPVVHLPPGAGLPHHPPRAGRDLLPELRHPCPG